MKKSHAILLVLVSVVLSHALTPAVAWAQAKAQIALGGVSVTAGNGLTGVGSTADPVMFSPSFSSGVTTSATAPQYSCSKTDGTCQFSSATADATTSSTVGAFTFKESADITAADLLLDVQDSSGAHALKVTEAGTVTGLTFVATSGSVGFAVPASTYISYSGNSTNGSFHLSTGANLYAGISSGFETLLTATAFSPAAASGNALGTTALPWDDLAGDSSMRGSCTLDGASPSKCTATVTASAFCLCGGKGTTAAAAVAAAASVSSTTLTCTAANGLTSDVYYHCIL